MARVNCSVPDDLYQLVMDESARRGEMAPWSGLLQDALRVWVGSAAVTPEEQRLAQLEALVARQADQLEQLWGVLDVERNRSTSSERQLELLGLRVDKLELKRRAARRSAPARKPRLEVAR